MAKGLLLVSGSPLIGNPIVYEVTAENLKGDIAFHRVRIAVKAAMICDSSDTNKSDTDYKEIVLSDNVKEGETIKIDISSALRSVADRYEYTATPPNSYPIIKFSIRAWDEYMQNGVLFKNIAETTNNGGTAIMGAFSDLERLRYGENAQVTFLSRKPTGKLLLEIEKDELSIRNLKRKKDSYPEIVVEGDTIIYPTLPNGKTIGDISKGAISNSYVAIIDKENPQGLRTLNNRNIYVKVKDKNEERYQFRFVNGFGVIETLSCLSLRNAQMTIEKEKFIMARQETFGSFSRGIYQKKNDFEKWKMASGPLDEYWQSWFLHEFLMSESVWILVNEKWLPCHIVPEETTQSINRVDNNMLDVLFTVEFDLKGPVK